MTARIPWVERRFGFDFPPGVYPELIERLRGTPDRLEGKFRDLAMELAVERPDEAWSLQEHAGHLADIEDLFERRLDDYASKRDVLHAADMSNQKTHEANHNKRPLTDVLSEFRRKREALVARLEALPPEAFDQKAHHPRLHRPLRLVDCMAFQAEHDDYHLARMSEILSLAHTK